MAFNYATAKSKLNDYLTAKVNVDAAHAAIIALGPRPVVPDIVTSQADYDNPRDAAAIWDDNMAAAQATYDSAYTTMRSFEFELIFYLAPNQWEKFTNAGGGVLTYTWWVAYCPTDPIDPQNGPMSGDHAEDISRQFVVFSSVQPATSFYNATKIPS